jgi:2-keto-4-pentenoate hydratase/2-oxohepta-3-ene-1,7-dioic acid hydratase in catechol pathway
MRILRFFSGDGSVHLGLRRDDMVADLGQGSVLDLIGGAQPAEARAVPYTGLALDAPIRDCRKFLALAGNYRKHIVESGYADVDRDQVLTPQVFWKPPTAINRPGGAIPLRSRNVFLDWEIELGVIIGRRTRNAAESDAMNSVFGYTVVNDISERKLNARLAGRTVRENDRFFDWLAGKWFDGSAPMGPEIVTADEIPDPHNLPLRLSVNGQVMQDSNTSQMIFRVPETIAYISAIMTLEPGDVIAMGTPDGVGSARGISLQAGDLVRGEIEGIGVLENVVVQEEA